MKRITKYLLIFVFVLSVFTLAACGKVKVDDITIGKSAITLEVEATEQINVTVLPEDAADKTVTFESESPAVATVSETGLVTAVAVGNTKITVKAGTIEKKVTVTVIKKGPEPLTVSAALALEDKAELTLQGQVIGIQGTQAWLADVQAGISLYAIPEGDLSKIVIGNVIVVTGKRADYSGTKQISDITEIKVVETGKPAMASINLTDLTEAKLNASNQKLIKGSFTVTAVPSAIEYNENGTLKNDLTFKLSDGTNEVIFFAKRYLSLAAVTAMKAVLEDIEVGGTVTFDKAVVGWYKLKAQILLLNNSVLTYVAPAVIDVTGLEVTNTDITLEQDGTEQIVYAVLPANATDKSVTFVSSDETIATVNETGLVTGVANGEATITVKAKTFEKTVTVTVAPPAPTSVVIKAADGFVLNEAKQLEAIAIPVGETVTYEWSVNDEAIATISETGELTFLASGDVIVSVKVVEYPELTNSRTFTLAAPSPTEISIEGDSKVIIHEVTKTYQYVATVAPEGALQSVIWTVNDVTKATVDANGVLTPIAEGSVQLTATSTVNDAITRIKFVQIENYIEPTVIISGSPMVSVGIPTPFSATVESNFLSKKVVWSISDEAIATISETGVVTGLTTGVVTVTATSVDDVALKSTFEVEVIEIAHKNIVIDATINEETSFELTYDSVVYYKGINAFTDFSDAAPLIQDGAIVYVLPGEYLKKATINASNIQILGPNAGVNPVTANETRTDEAIVQAQLTFGTKTNKLNNVKIDGLKFTGSGSIFAPYGIDSLSVYNVWFTNPSINPAQGMIFLSAPTTDVTSKDFVVEDSVFDDTTFLGYRGVRLNNTENITIKNNYFFKFFDAIRIECTNNGGFNVAPDGIGAAGVVLISGNQFEMNRQYPIILTVVSATQVDIVHNTISSDFVAGGTWGQVYLSNLVPAAGTKTIVNIKFNTFENMNNYHSVRIKSNGLTSADLEYNVNYNKWLVKNNDEESYIFCSMAEGDVDVVTNASNNYYPVAPKATDFTNVNKFEPFFTDLEAFEYAKGVELGEIDPLDLILLLEKEEIQVGKTGQLTSNLEGTTFVSSDEAIATIDTNGLITGVSEGVVTITATKGEQTATVTVTITMGYDPTKMMVDPAWASEVIGTMHVVNDVEYVFGFNGFATLAEAVLKSVENSTILVMAGEYDGGFDVVKAGVSIIAPNAETNPVDDETPFLATSATAVHINTEFYVSASNVTIKGISMTADSRLRGFTEISNFHFENNYVYDTSAATVAWQETTYAIDTSSSGTNTPGVINFAGSYTWQLNFQFINNKFYNVDDTNVFLGYADSATFIGNHFENFGRDAVRFDYGQNKGLFLIDDNSFINGKLNALYFRGYTADYGGTIDVTISNNRFGKVGYNPDAVEATRIEFAALAFRNHQEKDDATFNIFKNDFVDCPVALSLRNNYGASMTHEVNINVTYNAFINETVPTYYHRNQFLTDSNTSNPADAVFEYNYYGSSELVAVVPTASQFNNAVVNHENDFATYAALVAKRAKVELYGHFITSLDITKYSGSSDWTGLLVTLDPDKDRGIYWYNIVLRETTTKGLFEIVAIGTGAGFVAETDDYSIGLHDNNPLYVEFVALGLEVGNKVTFPGTDLATLTAGTVEVTAKFYGEAREDLPVELVLTLENTEVEVEQTT